MFICHVGILPREFDSWSEEKLASKAEKLLHIKIAKNEEEEFKDSVTGQPMNGDLVREARRKELEYFESMKVWIKKPREDSFKHMGKPPISVRWIDVNKGDDLNPECRSRLVAREIRRFGEEPIFAPTPPLESSRPVLTFVATDLP